jgi:diketogulonate reductase-like aldo/keto reductase
MVRAPWNAGHGLFAAWRPQWQFASRSHAFTCRRSTHGASAAAVALAWTIRSGTVIAIPESGSGTHVRENASALSLTLSPQGLEMLDAAYPSR